MDSVNRSVLLGLVHEEELPRSPDLHRLRVDHQPAEQVGMVPQPDKVRSEDLLFRTVIQKSDAGDGRVRKRSSFRRTFAAD